MIAARKRSIIDRLHDFADAIKPLGFNFDCFNRKRTSNASPASADRSRAPFASFLDVVESLLRVDPRF
ncbi:hypothetical protein DMP08_00290 [Paraeggerthella hongkongensis]|uniref:Uncharacterized protein n=1 Tax=Paraeggerthella hongkongensis TaxID=230658 RepID=A0A3N0BKK1_9ACTN|nr:hypothetical protein DMP08_00290 [Paraeggerthella hongkongensis]